MIQDDINIFFQDDQYVTTRLYFEKGVWLLVSCFIRSSSSQNWINIGQNWISSRISEGTFRPPGNLLLRLLLRLFRHEIKLYFAVSAVFRKRSLAASFLLQRQQQQSKLEIKIGFLVGFQKGRIISPIEIAMVKQAKTCEDPIHFVNKPGHSLVGQVVAVVGHPGCHKQLPFGAGFQSQL